MRAQVGGAPGRCREGAVSGRILSGLFVVACLCVAVFNASALKGTVTDVQGNPLYKAEVRLGTGGVEAPKAGLAATVTDGKGFWDLLPPTGGPTFIGAGKKGFINIAGMLQGTPADLPLDLQALPLIDSPEYQWRSRYVDKAIATNANFGCNSCHGEQNEDMEDSLHAEAATNKYMLALYSGESADGTPGVGPGYRLDNPDKAGPCANCHVPLAAVDAPNGFDPRDATGVAAEGVTCDVCHKVRNVVVNDKPGVAGAVELWRPPGSWGLFAFGPYVDASTMPMRTSVQPQIRRAEFCSGCHEYANEHGVPVMETYTEWTTVAGDDPDALHCQDCHMKRFDQHSDEEPWDWAYILDDDHVQNMHGILRDSRTIFPHTFHGASEEYLKEVAAIELETVQQDDVLEVSVLVENLYAGHALPTGMPFRNIILVMDVQLDGKPLEYMGEDVVPDYGGALAGTPGKGYAKVLGDDAGTRNVQFWNATQVLEDTRLQALGEDQLAFSYQLPTEGGKVTVRARLLYRKFFEPLAKVKGWELGEVVMLDEVVEVAAEPVTAGEDPVEDPDTPVEEPEEEIKPADARDGCAAGPAGVPSSLVVLLLLLAVLGAARLRQ